MQNQVLHQELDHISDTPSSQYNLLVTIVYDEYQKYHKANQGAMDNPDRVIQILNYLNTMVDYNKLNIIKYVTDNLKYTFNDDKNINCNVCTFENIKNTKFCIICNSKIEYQWRYLNEIQGDTTYETPMTDIVVHRANNIVSTNVCKFIESECKFTMCLLRPPSHHSCESTRAGFCHKNFVITALDIFNEYNKKVVILDIDAHHGDGTEKEIMKREYGYYISIHGYGDNVYPFTGSSINNNKLLNIPLDKDASDKEWIECMYALILPKIKTINPDYIILSCGFDAYYKDTTSPLKLTTKSYACLAKELKLLNIPIFSILEGGYYIPILGKLTELIINPFIN
jgi:acetoin utilization deacetylase AcuC-like enzyme